MTTIHEYRKQINHKLDCLGMEAKALENELTCTHKQVLQKYETLKMSLRNCLVTVKRKLKEYKHLTIEQRDLLIAKIDNVQISLSQSLVNTDQGVRDQRQQLMNSIMELEQNIDQYLKQKSTDFTGKMLEAIDRLNAEFAALEIFFYVHSQLAKESFQSNKDKLINQLHKLNHKFSKKIEANTNKALKVEKELSQGLKTIKSAFLHLKD